MMKYICALTIAGSDSCGGAGIQADIKTMSALGVYAASAITSVTVQNTLGVSAIQAINPDIVGGQIKAVMEDIRPQAVKIGMVNDRDTILAIASELTKFRDIVWQTLVIDPVMVSTSGYRLMQEDALSAFCDKLLPITTLLTPNIPEAEVLSGIRILTIEDMHLAARRILDQGCRAVLIKGGHMEGNQKVDMLYTKEGSIVDGQDAANPVSSYVHETIDTRNTHGTGCTLSSAITSFIARGMSLTDAVGAAKEYLSEAIETGKDVETGGGHGPVNHFYNPEKLIIINQ